jgi:hypothetical protein
MHLGLVLFSGSLGHLFSPPVQDFLRNSSLLPEHAFDGMMIARPTEMIRGR